MIKILYVIFAIVIEDLEIYFNNINLLLKKSIIGFKRLAQKNETNKQIANVLY